VIACAKDEEGEKAIAMVTRILVIKTGIRLRINLLVV
jgi:hypothetical protein